MELNILTELEYLIIIRNMLNKMSNRKKKHTVVTTLRIGDTIYEPSGCRAIVSLGCKIFSKSSSTSISPVERDLFRK